MKNENERYDLKTGVGILVQPEIECQVTHSLITPAQNFQPATGRYHIISCSPCILRFIGTVWLNVPLY